MPRAQVPGPARLLGRGRQAPAGAPPGAARAGPARLDCYENSFWEECSDYSDDDDDSIYSWEFMDDVDGYYAVGSDDEAIWDDGQGLDLDNLEVRFYGGGFSESFAGFDWPPSP